MSAFFDEVDTFFTNHATTPQGILFEVFCVIYCFFALAIVCDEYLAPALETLCVHWGVREDVAGATFLAFGSAAPEIVINAVTTIKSQVTSSNTTSLGISAIIGSGMLAFSFIPAMCCFASDIELKLKRRPLLRDESFYLVALFTLCAAFHDGKIVLMESVFLILVYIGHLMTVVTSPWVRRTYRYKVKGISLKETGSQQSFVHKAKEQLAKQRESQRSLKRASSQPTPTKNGHNDNGKSSVPRLSKAATANILLSNDNTSVNTKAVLVKTDSNFANLSGYDIMDSDDDESENDNIAMDMSTNASMAKAVYKHTYENETMETRLLDSKKEEEEENEPQLGRQISNESSSLQTDDDFYHSDYSDESDEGPTTCAGKAIYWFTMPLQILFKITCPPAGEGQSCEKLYGLTFAISVLHVAVFSFILSSVIGAWVDAWGMPQALFGMLLVAIGAEIPDTIESVTMARKAYGSMAVSNCQGTQVINIGIGLGLPWLMTNLTGRHVYVCGHGILQVSAIFQTGIVCTNFFLLVGLALIRNNNKARLQKWKAFMLIVLYFMVMLGFTLYLYFSDELFKNSC